MTSLFFPRMRLALSCSMALLSLSLGSFPLTADAQEHSTMPAMKPAVPSASLTVTANGKTVTYTPAQLLAMPQRSVTARNGHSGADEVYTGVGLDDLLAKAGYSQAGNGAQTIYHSYVRAEGTDHYFVIFSMSELEPVIHPGDALIALTLNGKPLGPEGAFKMVLAGEKRPSRWVRNLTALKVVTVE